jgi:hypothetical protein
MMTFFWRATVPKKGYLTLFALEAVGHTRYCGSELLPPRKSTKSDILF